ncbi:hypothetical protein BST61_g3286 [Cercospora zeina]
MAGIDALLPAKGHTYEDNYINAKFCTIKWVEADQKENALESAYWRVKSDKLFLELKAEADRFKKLNAADIPKVPHWEMTRLSSTEADEKIRAPYTAPKLDKEDQANPLYRQCVAEVAGAAKAVNSESTLLTAPGTEAPQTVLKLAEEFVSGGADTSNRNSGASKKDEVNYPARKNKRRKLFNASS